MIGSQKSSKIDSLKDPYGRVRYNRHDLYEMLYDGEDITAVTEVVWHEDFEKYNTAAKSNYVNTNHLTPLERLTSEIEEFDKTNQQHWFMPDEYNEYPIYDFCISLCNNDVERQRVDEEYQAFVARDMLGLLRYMVYLVDTMRKNNIVWGVGRGSSVASYVLYLLGIHRINSIHYDLDWREFLR